MGQIWANAHHDPNIPESHCHLHWLVDVLSATTSALPDPKPRTNNGCTVPPVDKSNLYKSN